MQHCEILLYAGDTVLYYHHSDLNVIEKALSEDLATMSSWLEENELILNLKKGKTEIMLFGTMARLNQQQISIEVSYRSQTIKRNQKLQVSRGNVGQIIEPEQSFFYSCMQENIDST